MAEQETAYFLCCLRPVLPRYSKLLPIRSTSAPSWDFFRFCRHLGTNPHSTSAHPLRGTRRWPRTGPLPLDRFAFQLSSPGQGAQSYLFGASSSLECGDLLLAASYASSASASLFMRISASLVSCASFIGKTGLCMLSRLSAALGTCCTIWLATRIVSPSPTIGCFPSLLPRSIFAGRTMPTAANSARWHLLPKSSYAVSVQHILPRGFSAHPLLRLALQSYARPDTATLRLRPAQPGPSRRNACHREAHAMELQCTAMDSCISSNRSRPRSSSLPNQRSSMPLTPHRTWAQQRDNSRVARHAYSSCACRPNRAFRRPVFHSSGLT